MDEKTKQIFVELTIPNEEVKYIFRRKVLSWFDQKVKQKDRTRLLQAVVDGDAETVEEEIGDMLLETISFNDAYESFYYGFLAGVLAGIKGYVVKSNREGGMDEAICLSRQYRTGKQLLWLSLRLPKVCGNWRRKQGRQSSRLRTDSICGSFMTMAMRLFINMALPFSERTVMLYSRSKQKFCRISNYLLPKVVLSYMMKLSTRLAETALDGRCRVGEPTGSVS